MIASLKHNYECLLEAGVMVLMTALALVVLAGITFRGLGSALVWYDEGASILLAWLTYVGAALAALKRAHIGVPGVVAALPAGGRLICFGIAEVLVFGFFALVAWIGWVVVEVLEGSMLASMPAVSVSLVQAIIPVGGVLFILAQALSLPDAWRATMRVAGPAPAAPRGGADDATATE